MTEEACGSIDADWWSPAFRVFASSGDLHQPELLCQSLVELAKQSPVGSLQQQVLEALAITSSPMLDVEDWNEPYKPTIQLLGRSSAVPSDLTQDQKKLLYRLVPLITQPTLRARVADVAWFYGDRSRTDFIDTAIDAYFSLPLDANVWDQIGRLSWRRGAALARRRGAKGQERLRTATMQVRETLLSSRTTNGIMVAEMSQFLRDYGQLGNDDGNAIANHLAYLAASCFTANTRLSRRYEQEARGWFARTQNDKAVHDCTRRIAESYIAEADQRLAAEQAGALVVGPLLEKAIAVLRHLPRSYRINAGIDAQVNALRGRLEDSREATLEAMTRYESDPVDLTSYAESVQAEVSGKDKFNALARLALMIPPQEAEQAFKVAREQVKGSLSRLFGHATFATDGRKVAAFGGSNSIQDDNYVWSAVVRNFTTRVGLVVEGVILPGHEIVTNEHRYTMEYLYQMCLESPTVPQDHELLWARGLWHGLNNDYASAASVLVPQIEHLLRYHLKTHGAHTYFVEEESGVESEKSFGALLDMQETEQVLGSGLILEFKALMVEQEGPNLRNEIAHGLITDAAAFSRSTVYAWWLALKLATSVLYAMRRDKSQDESPLS